MKIKRFAGQCLSELCRLVTSRYQLILLSFILATLCIRNDVHKTLKAFRKAGLLSNNGHQERKTLVDRNLKYAKTDEESKPEANQNNYVEVYRKQPKVSYSMSSTLEKFLEEERKKHNPSLSKSDDIPPKSQDDKMTVGGGKLVDTISNKENVISLKTALKDPSFVQKIGQLEDRRQQLYLNILKKRGQIVVGPDGTQTIVSYPKTPVKFPNNLKKNIADWSEKEKVWLNITHFPWPTDENCKHYSVQFAKPGEIPILGLASYPSSGNTWLRYLIEGITGYYTGSMYNDIMLRKKGFYGEGIPADSGMVLTVKTHGHTTGEGAHVAREKQVMYNHHKEVNNTAILLIRNPFKAIIGHRNLDAGGHTGFAKEDQFQGKGWQSFVEIKAAHWLNYYSDWLQNNPPENILVLHFENLQQNLKFSLRRISSFLGYKEDPGRMDCAFHYSTGSFKRSRKNGENPFTPEQRTIVENAIHQLNKILIKSQKETLPLDLYEFYNES